MSGKSSTIATVKNTFCAKSCVVCQLTPLITMEPYMVFSFIQLLYLSVFRYSVLPTTMRQSTILSPTRSQCTKENQYRTRPCLPTQTAPHVYFSASSACLVYSICRFWDVTCHLPFPFTNRLKSAHCCCRSLLFYFLIFP